MAQRPEQPRDLRGGHRLVDAREPVRGAVLALRAQLRVQKIILHLAVKFALRAPLQQLLRHSLRRGAPDALRVHGLFADVPHVDHPAGGPLVRTRVRSHREHGDVVARHADGANLRRMRHNPHRPRRVSVQRHRRDAANLTRGGVRRVRRARVPSHVERDDPRDGSAEGWAQDGPGRREGVHVDGANLVLVVGDEERERVGSPGIGHEGQRRGRRDATRGGSADRIVPDVDELDPALFRRVENVVPNDAALGADGYQLQSAPRARFKRQTSNRASSRVRPVLADEVEGALGFVLLGLRLDDGAVELEDGDASRGVGGGGVLIVLRHSEHRHRVLTESHRLNVRERPRVQRLERTVGRAHEDSATVAPVARRGGLGTLPLVRQVRFRDHEFALIIPRPRDAPAAQAEQQRFGRV